MSRSRETVPTGCSPTCGPPVRPEAVAYYSVLRTLFALAGISARRLTGVRKPNVWDNPVGVRNLVRPR